MTELIAQLVVAAPAATAVVITVIAMLKHMKRSQEIGHQVATELMNQFEHALERVEARHQTSCQSLAAAQNVLAKEIKEHTAHIKVLLNADKSK